MFNMLRLIHSHQMLKTYAKHVLHILHLVYAYNSKLVCSVHDKILYFFIMNDIIVNIL